MIGRNSAVHIKEYGKMFDAFSGSPSHGVSSISASIDSYDQDGFLVFAWLSAVVVVGFALLWSGFDTCGCEGFDG